MENVKFKIDEYNKDCFIINCYLSMNNYDDYFEMISLDSVGEAIAFVLKIPYNEYLTKMKFDLNSEYDCQNKRFYFLDYIQAQQALMWHESIYIMNKLSGV